MDLFSLVENGVAIIRLAKGVHKQVKVYHRGERVFIAHAGGFIRIVAKFGDEWSTGHPDVKVIGLEGDGLQRLDKEPRFAPALKVAA